MIGTLIKTDIYIFLNSLLNFPVALSFTTLLKNELLYANNLIRVL